MNKERTLPFPAGGPDPYKPLVDEPIFDPARHLALGSLSETFKLGELDYKESELEGFAFDFAYSSAFRILFDEGVTAGAIAKESELEAESENAIEIKKR